MEGIPAPFPDARIQPGDLGDRICVVHIVNISFVVMSGIKESRYFCVAARSSERTPRSEQARKSNKKVSRLRAAFLFILLDGVSVWVEKIYIIFGPGGLPYKIRRRYTGYEGWWIVKRRVVKKRNMVVVSMIARSGAGAGPHKTDKRKNRKPKHRKDWRKDEDQ
jgi:hypothetical protein